MSITATMRGQELTVRVDLPEHVQLPVITKAIQEAIANHPKPPAPGQVTRNGFASACSGPHVPWEDSTQEAWAAAEAAARAGYVSKTEILKILENYDLARPETCDLVDVICEIRELVK